MVKGIIPVRHHYCEGIVTSERAAETIAKSRLKKAKDGTVLVLSFWNGSGYYRKEKGEVREMDDVDVDLLRELFKNGVVICETRRRNG